MIRKRSFLLAAVLLVLVAGVLVYNSIPKGEPALSAPYAKALRSGCYYMECGAWLLNTPEPTRLELARDGSSTFQRYRQADGQTVTSVTRDGISRVFSDGELLQETRDSTTWAPDYAGLKDTGGRGTVTLEGEQFTYEEYRLEGERLRFLFQGEELRGLHTGDRDYYTRIVTLSPDIPAEIQTMMAQ